MLKNKIVFIPIIIIFLIIFIVAMLLVYENSSNYCLSKDGENKMGIIEAKILANLVCRDEGGDLSNEYYCVSNEDAWKVEIRNVKKGCYTSCNIDINKREVNVGYRCTGYEMPPEPYRNVTPLPDNYQDLNP